MRFLAFIEIYFRGSFGNVANDEPFEKENSTFLFRFSAFVALRNCSTFRQDFQERYWGSVVAVMALQTVIGAHF